MIEGLPDQPTITRLMDAAEALTGTDLTAIDRLAEPAELADTRVAQPLLYLADWAWGAALLDAGLEPVAVAGHSLGELAALALAGVYSVEAGLHLVVERARLMASAASSSPGAMAAVLGLAPGSVEDALETVDGVWVANDNCPGQIVVSGTDKGISAAEESLRSAGAKRVVRLAVSGAFHTPLMADAAAAFADTLDAADFTDATVPVVQNAAPMGPVTDAGHIKTNLKAQITGPVRWTETMATLDSLGADVLIEAGPGAVLTGLARRSGTLTGMPVEDAGIDGVIEEVLS